MLHASRLAKRRKGPPGTRAAASTVRALAEQRTAQVFGPRPLVPADMPTSRYFRLAIERAFQLGYEAGWIDRCDPILREVIEAFGEPEDDPT